MNVTTKVKKNNHQVTRALLSQWSGLHDGKPGLFYYDITKQKKDFSQGKAASFAIVEYLYAPTQADGNRNDDLENEFSINERALGLLIKSAVSVDGEIGKLKWQKSAIKSCISLGFRSAYYAARTAMILHGNNVRPEEIHRRSIEVMKNTLQNRYNKFENWHYIVVRNLDKDLLINEQPFRDWTIHKNPADFVTMPLTPRSLLFGVPSGTGQFKLEWKNYAHDRVNVDNHNTFIIETARHFVAAKTEQQLDCFIHKLTEELVKARMATDRIVTL